jgi:hypothetical protein
MNENEFEKQIRGIAKGMEYPRTPDIAGFVTTRLRSFSSPAGRGDRRRTEPVEVGEGRPRLISRRAAWSLTLLLILLSSLLLIPPARAAILEFIQIGIVRIFPAPEETPTTAVPESFAPVTATPSSQSIPLLNFLDQIAGETKLANAQEMTGYPILLPTYPPELGLPNHVYVQDANGAMTILVWVDAAQPGRVTLSLHFIPQGSWAIQKFQPSVIEETEVNGQRAVWTVGPYPLISRNGDVELTRMVEGHVLIWESDGVTYRLETGLSLEETLKIAESLQPMP